jgi:hypothetical protein
MYCYTLVYGMYCIFYSYVQKNIRKNLHSLKLDVLEADGGEEGVSSELAELGRRADQLAHKLRNLRYRLVCRKIGLIESNTRCRHLKRFTCKGLVFICLRPPQVFVWGGLATL